MTRSCLLSITSLRLHSLAYRPSTLSACPGTCQAGGLGQGVPGQVGQALQKKMGLAALHPASPSGIIRMHKGCRTPRVHGLGRPPSFGFSQDRPLPKPARTGRPRPLFICNPPKNQRYRVSGGLDLEIQPQGFCRRKKTDQLSGRFRYSLLEGLVPPRVRG